MKDIKAKVVTKPTGNKKPNKPATVAKKASVKFEGPKSTPPTKATPMKMKMGGMKSKKVVNMKKKCAACEKAKMKKGGSTSAFAKLAPPTNKITFADKIAGAKKKK